MSRTQMNHLFSEGHLRSTLDAHFAGIRDAVNSIPRDQFLASSDEEIIAHVHAKKVVESIKLHEERIEMEQEEIQLDVSSSHERNPFARSGPLYIPGFRIRVTIPFSGDPALWKLRPSSYKSVLPLGNIRRPARSGEGYFEMVFEQPADVPPERLKAELDRNLGLIRDYLSYQESDVDHQNSQLVTLIRQEIQARRERLEKQDGIARMLGIPLKRREGAPSVRPIRVEKRIVQPLPPPPKSGYKAEPGIADSDYEDIISIIRHEGRTFETTPATYSVHGEEDLRNILLAHLNGHYKGGATGETFRSAGKTDIRIEDSERSAFIAECKVWAGTKTLSGAIDQILSYLTWRDCKCALIVFNKAQSRFSDLLAKVPAVMSSHPQLHKDLGPQADGEWRFVFTANEDEARRIVLHVFLFNLNVPRSKKSTGRRRAGA